MSFVHSRAATVLTVVLALQLTAFYALALRTEDVPNIQPLAVFPAHIGDWMVDREYPLDQETLDVLKADDTMQRLYVDPVTQRAAYLFIAFFKTQRTGQSPHSPKNCLPGSGWEPITDDRPFIQVPGEAAPIKINRYVTQKGTDTDVVLYWYQSHGRVVANEFAAKFWSVADAMRYNRSDTSLVRVSVRVANGDIDDAWRTGLRFTQAVFPNLLSRLPR